MNNKQLTLWQDLNNDFGSNSLLGQDIPTFKFNKEVLLKTTDRQKYEKEKLELQQTMYLKNQWVKIENNLYTQSVYYQPTRLASYYDYESMEYTPEISAALDTFAEESTTTDKDGEMLQIYSESKRVRNVLRELFDNVLDINTNLPMWVRNTCKYGDNFVYLKLDPAKGVVGCLQLPNIEIERVEKGMTKQREGGSGVSEEAKELRFSWSSRNLTFHTWEVAHFRLMGDDRKLPYGTSILEKARRIWKQLVLAEDAMLIYRTSRAPERRVFKVFVGNMDDKDVEPYVQRFANKFKRDQVADSKTGNVDLRFNQMAVDQDYFVPVRDITAPNPIDTLPGASNLDAIADIEYIQKKLLTALRIPKTFLGFEEVVADGKNLSLQDIRFARTINRIQKSMLAELNKVALIHLLILGLKDDLGNFTLGLTNPSTQADLLRLDAEKEKINLYKDATMEVEGIAPMSHSRAKKTILGMSDEEVRLDLLKQRVERALAGELKNTAEVIAKTGLFDPIDKIYGTQGGQQPAAQEPNAQMGLPPVSSPTPSFGGGGGDLGDMGDMGDVDLELPELDEPEAEGEEPEAEGEDEIFPESVEDRISNEVTSNFSLKRTFLPLDVQINKLDNMEKNLRKLLDS